MEKEIKFYVVRASFGAEVYANLDFAKEEVKNYLHISDFSEDLAVTIETWVSTGTVVKGWQWVSYNRRKVAARAEFDNIAGDHLEFFAKDFAKHHGAGYMRQEVYTFGVSEGKFFGSINGRPTDTDFLNIQYHCNHWPLARF